MQKFHKYILSWNSTCFGQFVCPSSRVYSLYTHQWYMSYRFVDSFRAGPRWTACSSILVLLENWHTPLLSVQWINVWWWTDELFETCRVLWQNKICEIGASSWFYYKRNSACLLVGRSWSPTYYWHGFYAWKIYLVWVVILLADWMYCWEINVTA